MFCSRDGRWSRRGGGYEYYGQVELTASGTKTTPGSATKKIIGTGLLQPTYAYVSANANPSYFNGRIQKIDDVNSSYYNFSITGQAGGSYTCAICGMNAMYTGAMGASNSYNAMYLYGVMPMIPFNKNIELNITVGHSNTSAPSYINYGYFYFDVWKKVDTEIVVQ